MLQLYVATAVLGAVLALVGLLGGHGDAMHGDLGGFEHDSLDGHGGSDHDGAFHGAAEWLPFLSLRFWTYGTLTFGACGIALTQWTHLGEPSIGVVGGIAGLLVGTAVATTVRLLSRDTVDSKVDLKQLVGKEVSVLVPVRPGLLGQARVVLSNETLDLPAIADRDETFEAGSKAIVIGVDSGRLELVKSEDLLRE